MSSCMKRGALCVALVASIGLAGCNGDKPAPTEDFQNLRTLDQSPDQPNGWAEELGQLMPNQTRQVHYRNPARLRLFRITIAANVKVNINVKSSNGDAVAWLVDSQYNVKAWNDDYQSGSSDSRIQWQAPAQQKSEIYYLAFRDYGLNQADFNVGYGEQCDGQHPNGGDNGNQNGQGTQGNQNGDQGNQGNQNGDQGNQGNQNGDQGNQGNQNGGQYGGQNGGQSGQGCDKGQLQGSCSPGWVWDDQSCECVEQDGGHCGKEQSCDKGSYWDPQSCACRPNGYK